MASITAACLFQETRLNLDPAFPGATVDIQVPSQSSLFSSRASPKRRRLDRPTISYNEDQFTKHHLASESSIHFRTQSQHASKQTPDPRAILWRVLNDRKLLELQVVDLVQPKTDRHEPLLTLRFHFSSSIRPAGVAFPVHETEQVHDTFIIFVLTQTGELFTMKLRKDMFVKPNLIEETPNWCRNFSPGVFGHRTPLMLYANNEKELWATLTDGTLVRLDGSDGSAWRESFFTQGGWKTSMLGLLPWKGQSSVRFEDTDLYSNAAISIDLSPDGDYVWTVCLDHTLKAWSTQSGKLVFNQDLSADLQRDLETPPELPVAPSRAKLLQIVPSKHRQEYFVVTFSPPTRQFKIWMIRDLEAPEYGWEDACPDLSIVPPIEDLTNTSFWSLQSFHIVPSPKTGFPWKLWILVRAGSRSFTYRATFGFRPRSKQANLSFDDDWVSVDAGLDSVEALKLNVQNPSGVEVANNFIQASDCQGIVDKWLDFLFCPGRFTTPTLATALTVYCGNLGQKSGSHPTTNDSDECSLKARICESIGSFVQLSPADANEISYERYQRNIAIQWQTFYGVLQDLHNRREAVLNLNIDHEEGLAWLVMADYISPIRSCSESEILWHNRISFSDPEKFGAGNILLDSLSDARNSQLGQLFYALDSFHTSLSKSFLQKFTTTVCSELLDNSLLEGSGDVIHSIYEKSGFGGQVSDEDYNSLTLALGPLGGFANLDNDILTRALEFLDEAQKGRSHKNQLTRYGARAIVRGSQETLELGFMLLIDLLLIVTFIAEELEKDDLPESFDAILVASALFRRLKEYNLLRWLASTAYHDVRAKSSHDGKQEIFQLNAETQTPTLVTLLEHVFIGDWTTLRNPSTTSTPELITYWCRAWTFGLRLEEQYDKIVCHVLGVLVKSGDRNLAASFQSFAPETPWGEYLLARLCLTTSNFADAASHFKTSANGLVDSKHVTPSELDSAGLLDGVERTFLNAGYAKFYQHVIDLFEHYKAPSYVADFAVLALRDLSPKDQKDANVKTNLLSRLFSACLRTLRFRGAFTALIQYTDLALRRSSLKSLIRTLLKSNQIGTLLKLPYPADLVGEVDEHLTEMVESSVSSQTPDMLGSLFAESGGKQHQYHKILYAFRFQRDDLRGAGSSLWQHLQALREEQRKGLRGEDVDEEVAQTYLALINVLSLMEADQAWILTKPMTLKEKTDGPGRAGRQDKRRVVTLEDVRKMWQEELDRAADIAAGRFSFGFGSQAMEVDA